MQSGNTPQSKDYFEGLQTPNVNDMELQLQQLVEQGTINPEQAATILQERSGMNDISSDPRFKQNQMDALLGLQEISDSGGMTAMDKSNLRQIQSEEDSSARGKRDAIIQNAQSRGLGGSGLELMSQMQNQQDSATRTSQRDMGVAAQSQQRALEALMQQGAMSGQMQNQDFNQQAQKATANDAISRFNAQNTQQQINTNVGANNAAQATNLANKQNIANTNAASANAQQQYNKELLQKDYDNKLKKAGGQTSVAQANAKNAGADSQASANANNQLIGGLFGLGSAAAGAKGKKQGGIIDGEPSEFDSVMTPTQPGEFVVRKEDVPNMLMKAHTDDDGEFDAAGFLDSVTGHKYGYKQGKK